MSRCTCCSSNLTAGILLHLLLALARHDTSPTSKSTVNWSYSIAATRFRSTCYAAPHNGNLDLPTHGPLKSRAGITTGLSRPPFVMSLDKLDVTNPIDPSTTTESTSRDVVSDLSAVFDATRSSDVHLSQKAPPTSAPSGPKIKRQQPSRSKFSKVTKPAQRSLSTSYVQALVMSDSDADKKRNKLGYQRISIACAHCRRRKIRCLVADADPHGRCQNCIRLKKECVFYPVDQQTVIESSSQSAGQPGAASGPSSAVSSSTPPNLALGSTFEGSRDTEGFPTLPSNAPSGYGGVSSELGSSVPSTNIHAFDQFAGRLAQSDPIYRQHMDTQSPWINATGFQYQMTTPTPSAHDFTNPNYWRHNVGASPGDYAPFPYGSMTTATTVPNPHAFDHRPTNLMWPPAQPQQQQARSMSYSQIEGYQQNMDPYGGFHLGGQQPSLRNIPHPLQMQSPTTMAQPPGPHSAPIAPHPQSFMGQHPSHMQQNPFQQSEATTSTQGYSDPFTNTSPRLGTLQEEQSGHSYARHSSQPG